MIPRAHYHCVPSHHFLNPQLSSPLSNLLTDVATSQCFGQGYKDYLDQGLEFYFLGLNKDIEDEMEMLQEARARLADTQGKKAKRKAREKC